MYTLSFPVPTGKVLLILRHLLGPYWIFSTRFQGRSFTTDFPLKNRMHCESTSSLLGVRRWSRGLNGKLNKPKTTRVSPRLGSETATHRPTATTASPAPIHIHPMTGNGTGLSSSEMTVASPAGAAVKQVVIDAEGKKEEPGSLPGLRGTRPRQGTRLGYPTTLLNESAAVWIRKGSVECLLDYAALSLR